MKYIVLFRGINVGGKYIVKMVDLRRFLSDLGLYNVTAYIQSGNAVFETVFEEAPFPGLYGMSLRKTSDLKAV